MILRPALSSKLPKSPRAESNLDGIDFTNSTVALKLSAIPLKKLRPASTALDNILAAHAATCVNAKVRNFRMFAGSSAKKVNMASMAFGIVSVKNVTIASMIVNVISLMFSHRLIQKLRKSSLVFHRYRKPATNAEIAVMISVNGLIAITAFNAF